MAALWIRFNDAGQPVRISIDAMRDVMDMIDRLCTRPELVGVGSSQVTVRTEQYEVEAALSSLAPNSSRSPLIVRFPVPHRAVVHDPNKMICKTDGVDLARPHLPRIHLIDRMNECLESTQFLLLYSSAASGKTSLLKLFANQDDIDDDQVIYISCLQSDETGYDLLKDAGIDLSKKTCPLPRSKDRLIYIMIDDAQAKYSETNFWTMLVKGTALWLPRNVKFIIATTHLFAGDTTTLVEFASLTSIRREDLLLTQSEYEMLLNPDAGFTNLSLPDDLKEIMWRECGGLIGAVIIAVNAINDRFGKDNCPS